MMKELDTIIFGSELVVGAVLAYLYVKSRLPKETIDQQTKLITTLEVRIKTMEMENREQLKKHAENERAISVLQGQIAAYKEIPLQDIAKSLKALENLPREFQKTTQENGDKILKAINSVLNNEQRIRSVKK